MLHGIINSDFFKQTEDFIEVKQFKPIKIEFNYKKDDLFKQLNLGEFELKVLLVVVLEGLNYYIEHKTYRGFKISTVEIWEKIFNKNSATKEKELNSINLTMEYFRRCMVYYDFFSGDYDEPLLDLDGIDYRNTGVEEIFLSHGWGGNSDDKTYFSMSYPHFVTLWRTYGNDVLDKLSKELGYDSKQIFKLINDDLQCKKIVTAEEDFKLHRKLLHEAMNDGKKFDVQKRRSIKKANITTQVTNNMLNVYDDEEDFEEPRETKTERLFILITPSLNKQLKKTARRLNTSKNALVNEALDRYLNNLTEK